MLLNSPHGPSFRAVQLAAITTNGRVYSAAPFVDVNGEPLTDADWAWVNALQANEAIRSSHTEGKATSPVNWWVKDARGGSHLMGAGDYLMYTEAHELYAMPQATFEFLFPVA